MFIRGSGESITYPSSVRESRGRAEARRNAAEVGAPRLHVSSGREHVRHRRRRVLLSLFLDTDMHIAQAELGVITRRAYARKCAPRETFDRPRFPPLLGIDMCQRVSTVAEQHLGTPRVVEPGKSPREKRK